MPGTVETATSLKQRSIDYLQNVEHTLRDLWSQYVNYVDKNGFNEEAKSLRDRYFKIYRSYRQNKKWREIMNV